ncbi:HD-GYP domain-containing protein [Sporosarcina sp. Te-1]|uniref:HD-GYP domain-containing protein n=1 Tax=Sporosarcina sp. Te-1 TaxID=2818390 RepID=UPI001A9CC6F3|nr:HD-GYP domain-containing protein [Sporosarcina sp. Te-1]QTD40183.1 HD-GYP domain-containing protein [Sporosarcina sp. Te-1]
MELYKNTSDLRPGILLKEDVFVKTKYPIMRKDTELTPEHLYALRAFGVTRVKVEERVAPDKLTDEEQDTHAMSTADMLKNMPISRETLRKQYYETVRNYKKEFMGWRAGAKVDSAKVRQTVLPLLESFASQKNMLVALNELSDSKDYLYHHSVGVGILAAAISNQLGYPTGDALQLGLAGVLADVGMAKIDPQIPEKSAFLSREEYNEVKKHTIFSFQMLQETPLLRKEMKLAVFQHHERLDGSGYPRGDKSDSITVYSQILAVSDVFHAMTSERIYRSKQSPYKVLEMIKEEEFGKFDIKIVQALESLIGNISIGARVKLSDGEIGEVMFIHRDSPLRPLVKKLPSGETVDLAAKRSLSIEKVLE